MTISTRKLSRMKKVLLDPNARGPRWTYFMIRSLPLFSRGDIRCDLTIIPPCRLRRELNKTFGHKHKGDESETYKVLWGKALFVLQEMKDKDSISEIKLIEGRGGDRITIAGKYYHKSINRGRTPLVLVNWLKKGTENDYSLIEDRQGFGYYVIASDTSEFKLVRNENYEEVPEVELESCL